MKKNLILKSRLKLAKHIADGMNNLSACGIIHRDLKPANILVDENYVAAITDYGVSRSVSNLELNYTLGVGSPLFMAPELLAGSVKIYGTEVDIYSFGILLYQVVTTRVPYSEHKFETFFQFVDQVQVKGARPSFSNLNVPKSLEDLTKACWSPNPKERKSFFYCSQILTNEIDNLPDA